MNASVIVCTYNRAESLPEALESLRRQVLPAAFAWEVLIVDNNSTDSTKDVCKAFVSKSPGMFRYVFESRQGKSFALNAGIREAKGELIAFTDDDVTVHADWLAQLVETFEKHSCAGVGGKIVPVWTTPKPNWLEMEGPHRLMNAVVSFDLGESPCPIKAAALGANFAFKKEMFQKYGGFRADLGPTVGSEIRGEDSEFCRRLIKGGETLIYSPTAIVYHPVEKRRTEKRYFEAWYIGRGRASVREGGTPTNAVRYFGIPRYLYASLSRDFAKWILCPSIKLRFHYKLQMFQTWGQMLESRSASPHLAAAGPSTDGQVSQ